VIRVSAGVVLVPLLAALAVGGAAAAHRPSPGQEPALIAALRGAQGDVAIQAVTVSSADGGFASIDWGFANNGYSARNNSVLARRGGDWQILWTRELEQPADGACVYVPALVAHDLLRVTCPPPATLHATSATRAETAVIRASFLTSAVTPYARSSRLGHVCVSRLDPRWAAAASVSNVSGAVAYVWFRHGLHWNPTYESMAQINLPPPPRVVLSLASCVGYNPADYGG
jgi:hypothetical protein